MCILTKKLYLRILLHSWVNLLTPSKLWRGRVNRGRASLSPNFGPIRTTPHDRHVRVMSGMALRILRIRFTLLIHGEVVSSVKYVAQTTGGRRQGESIVYQAGITPVGPQVASQVGEEGKVGLLQRHFGLRVYCLQVADSTVDRQDKTSLSVACDKYEITGLSGLGLPFADHDDDHRVPLLIDHVRTNSLAPCFDRSYWSWCQEPPRQIQLGFSSIYELGETHLHRV